MVDYDALTKLAESLHEEADQCEDVDEQPKSVREQLGLLLHEGGDREANIKKIIRDWDLKGRGEVLRAEFRLNLRRSGINATSAESDALFDSWDGAMRACMYMSCTCCMCA